MEVRVQLKREQEAGPEKGGFHFSVFARVGEWVEHSTGHIEPCLMRPVYRIDRAAVAARCHEREIVFDELHPDQAGALRRFRPPLALSQASADWQARGSGGVGVG